VTATADPHSVVGPADDRPAGEPRPGRGDGPLLAALVAGALAVFAFATSRRLGMMPMGDEPHYLIIGQALAEYGSVDPSPVYEHRDYWSYYPKEIDSHVVRGAGGRPVPLHGLGGPLLWLVPFLLWGRLGAHLVVVAASVLTVVNVFRLQRELGIRREYAGFVTGLFVVGTPLYTYASMLYIEPIGALLVIVAARVVLATRVSRPRLVLASAGLGYLPWVHGRMILFTVVLGALLAARLVVQTARRSPWPYVQGLLPLVLLLVAFETFTAVRYGTLNPAPGNAAHGDGLFGLMPHRGLLFLMLDGRFGLFPNFPILMFAVPGLLLAASRGLLRVHVVLLGAVGPYLFAMSTFPTWPGGFSPPARLLAVTTPLLAYYVAVALQRLHHRLVNTAAAIGGGYAFIMALSSDLRPIERFHTIRNPMCIPCARLAMMTDLPVDRLVPIASDGHRLVGAEAGLFGAWAVVVLAAAAAAWLVGRGSPPVDVPNRPPRDDPAGSSGSAVASAPQLSANSLNSGSRRTMRPT